MVKRDILSTLRRVLVNGQERYSFVIDNQVLSRINKEACWMISNITAGNKGEIQVVPDAHNGLTSTMKPGANWVDIHLLEWMYVFYGVRKIWEEGRGVLYGEVHEKRMHHLFFNDTSFCHGPGLLVGKWRSGTSSYICYLRIVYGAQWFSIFFLVISHFENL